MDDASELPEDPPMVGFENLEMVKMTNFKWQRFEIELVHFLFRKASNLQKLILVAAARGMQPQRDQSGNPFLPGGKVLRIDRAPVNALTVFSDPDCSKIWAFHRYVFSEC